MAFLLREVDTGWIKTQYPKLSIDAVNNKIEGELSFKISFNGYKIEDAYMVKVDFDKLDSNGLPKVFETSGKIYDIARKYKVESEDLHINPDGSFCITIQGKEKELFHNAFTLQEFFQNGIEMFLFQMSYFDNEGKFPWGEYAHGYLGHLEYYAEGEIDIQELISRLTKVEIIKTLLLNRQSECLCGSRKKLRKCHPMILRGINKMKSEHYK